MGASVADYDSDGRDDVYVTALGGNHLFHNRGGRFEDVTRAAGVAD
jgi:enediyne biosynthesis protein E4